MKLTLHAVAASALLGSVAFAGSLHDRRHAHEALHKLRRQASTDTTVNGTCGCTTYYTTYWGEPTLIQPAPVNTTVANPTVYSQGNITVSPTSAAPSSHVAAASSNITNASGSALYTPTSTSSTVVATTADTSVYSSPASPSSSGSSIYSAPLSSNSSLGYSSSTPTRSSFSSSEYSSSNPSSSSSLDSVYYAPSSSHSSASSVYYSPASSLSSDSSVYYAPSSSSTSDSSVYYALSSSLSSDSSVYYAPSSSSSSDSSVYYVPSSSSSSDSSVYYVPSSSSSSDSSVYYAPSPSSSSDSSVYYVPSSSSSSDSSVYYAPSPSSSSDSSVYYTPSSSSSSTSSVYYAPASSSVYYAPSSSSYSAPPASSSTSSASTGGSTWCMTYTPYIVGGCKDPTTVKSDIATIAAKGFTCLRLYSTDCSGLQNVADNAISHGMKLILGVYIDKKGTDAAQPQVTDIANWINGNQDSVKMVVVGNEAIFNKFTDASSLATFVGNTKQTLKGKGYNGPVTTCETMDVLNQNKDTLCPVIDVPVANIHPFFNSSCTPEQAGAMVADNLESLKGICGHDDAYNLETGWPNAGEDNGSAKPSEDNQKKAIESIQQAAGDKSVFFSFEDDMWKEPGYLSEFGPFGPWNSGDEDN